MQLEGQNLTVYSVSEVNALARTLLEDSFPDIWLQGEVSGFKPYRSGHWYFSLKDEEAEIRCVMFRGDNLRVRFEPTDGAQVRLRCRISLYEERGSYQAIAREMQLAGTGELLAALEALRNKLASEGLLAEEKKRLLPKFPRHLAVITSPSGAALRDILKTLRTRRALSQCTLLPVSVQGANAAPEIVRALKQVANWPAQLGSPPDIVLLGRGGGSLEDLWAFNLEPVARAIAACQIPVVTGIGHETDTTISDMVADQRAATPTAAAALATPDYHQVNGQIVELVRQFTAQFSKQLRRLKQDHLRQWIDRLVARDPQRVVDQGSQRLDDHQYRLDRAMRLLHQHRKGRFKEVIHRLQRVNPTPRIAGTQAALVDLVARFDVSQLRLRRELAISLKGLVSRLEAVSPKGTLERGYAILARHPVEGAEYGQPVTAVSDAQVGEPLLAHLVDGQLEVTVHQIHEATQ